jgi:hemoglobin-like flavoprotein
MNPATFDPHERTLLYTSYQKLAAAGPAITTMFYTQLFETDPALQRLFNTAMITQGVKFRLMLNLMLSVIDQPAELEKLLHELGRRHRAYGVKREDYPLFMNALLRTIQQYLGADFTPEIEAAWRKLFGVIVDRAAHADPDTS